MPSLVLNGFPLWAVLSLIGGSAILLGLLHCLRVRPLRVPVVTTLFWHDAAQQAQAATLHKRFRHPLTYMLLLAICLLLTLALGDPVVSYDDAQRSWNVIVVDAGVSMNTHVKERSWWNEARTATLSQIGQLPVHSRVAVIVCDPFPRIALAFDEPREWLPLRLDAIQPANMPADRAAALRMADDLIQQSASAGEIILVSSHAAPTRVAETMTAQVRTVLVGNPVDNAAILSAVFAGLDNDPQRGNVVVRLGYWGKAARNVQVKCRNDRGDDLGSKALRLSPGEEDAVVIENVPADGSTLTITLDQEDGLHLDNQLIFQLPSRPRRNASVDNIRNPQLRALLDGSGAIRVIDSNTTGPAELLISDALSHPTLPTLSIAASGKLIDRPHLVTAVGNASLVADLEFGGDMTGIGPALELADRDTACLMAGEYCVAAMNLQAIPPYLRLSPVLLSDDASVRNHPALAVFLTRSARALAGWQSAVVQPADRVMSDPRWSDRAGIHVSASMTTRLSSNTAGTQDERPISTSGKAGFGWRWFQTIIMLAVVAAGVEAVLHVRARIP